MLLLTSFRKAVGGTASTEGLKAQTPAELEAELAAFDVRIYKAQRDMADSMSTEMKALGVPFFGTNQDLIRLKADVPSDELRNEVRPKWSPRITVQEYADLRTRIIRYLEDMYKD